MTITLTGLTNSYPLPGEFAEILFAQGPSSGATASYNALIMGNMLSSGTATPETVVYGPDSTVSMSSEDDAILLFGDGSELHRMAKKFYDVNTSTPLYAIAIADGYGGAASTGTIVIANTATGNATLRIYVADDFCDVGIITGDSPITIATNGVAAVQAKSHWPINASNSGTGTITLIAKQIGVRGNDIDYQAQLLPSNITTTITATATTLMSGGTVQDNNTNALAQIDPVRYYYIVSAPNDATNLARLNSQVAVQALPLNGIRQRWMSGSRAPSVSTANTLATGLNSPRGEITWQMASDWLPSELSANMAAVVSLVEANFGPLALNFDSFGANANTSGLWKVKAPRSGISPTKLQQVSALNNGVTPIASTSSGQSYLVKLITTYSLNGIVPDYRVRDWHKVSVCDRYTDDLLAQAAALLRGRTVDSDPIGNEPTPDGAVTPTGLKALINRKTRDYFEGGLLRDLATILANTQILYDPILTPNRISALIPLEPVNILDQVAFKISQVG